MAYTQKTGHITCPDVHAFPNISQVLSFFIITLFYVNIWRKLMLVW